MCFLQLVPFGSEKNSSHANKAGFCYFGVLSKIFDKFPCAFLWESIPLPPPPTTGFQLPPLSMYMYIYPSCESFILTCKDMSCLISVYHNCYPLVVRNLMMVILSWETKPFTLSPPLSVWNCEKKNVQSWCNVLDEFVSTAHCLCTQFQLFKGLRLCF